MWTLHYIKKIDWMFLLPWESVRVRRVWWSSWPLWNTGTEVHDITPRLSRQHAVRKCFKDRCMSLSWRKLATWRRRSGTGTQTVSTDSVPAMFSLGFPDFTCHYIWNITCQCHYERMHKCMHTEIIECSIICSVYWTCVFSLQSGMANTHEGNITFVYNALILCCDAVAGDMLTYIDHIVYTFKAGHEQVPLRGSSRLLVHILCFA